MGVKQSIVSIFISHYGCGHACIFCNQRKITGVVEIPKANALKVEIDQQLETIKSDIIEIAFFGGSFTGIPVKQQIEYLEIARDYKVRGKCHRIRLSTRPDYISPEIVERLMQYQVDLVELGCQSFSNAVLAASKRGHDKNAIYTAIDILKRYDIDFGIQLMAGLPGDTKTIFMRSVEAAIGLKPHTVRLYPALVIKDTEMEALYLNGLYQPIDLETAIDWCASALRKFRRQGINVIRIGLQNTDLIELGADVVAGPFHSAFGALVYSKIFRDAIVKVLTESSNLIVWVHPSQMSYVNGQGKCNLPFYRDVFNTYKIQILQDKNIPKDHLKIDTGCEIRWTYVMDE